MDSFRYPDPRGCEIDATRRRRTAGVGMCLGSVLGLATAALIDLPVASALFGVAVPVFLAQIWREHRLLRRHRRPVDAPNREALN